MQKSRGQFDDCSDMIQSKRCAAMNLITFMKVLSQDLFRGTRRNLN